MHKSKYIVAVLVLAVAVGGCFFVRGIKLSSAGDHDSGEIRIVSLAPNITEAVCAVGAADLLAGRTSACNYPADVLKSVPVIGDFGVPSLEMLVSVHPTLVLDSDLADESVGRRIDAMGIKRRRIDCRTLDDIGNMLREIGVLTGHAARGNELADEIDRRLNEYRLEATNGVRPRVYAEVWHDPMTTTGSGTVLSDLISLAGGINIGDAAHKSYFQISPESVVEADPDIILCLYMDAEEGAAEAVKRRPGWRNLKAVRTGAVYDGLNNDVLLRPGPRVVEAVELLKACFNQRRVKAAPDER